MSFCYDVKSEICKRGEPDGCCAAAEAYGALLFAQSFCAQSIRLVTEHPDVARRVALLLTRAFALPAPVVSAARTRTLSKYTLHITQEEQIAAVRDKLGYGRAPEVALHLNNAVVEERCCQTAFLRGAFLSGGFILDPEKKYHLEFVTPHYHLSHEFFAILLELQWQPKITARRGGQVVYFKASESIEDFLTTVGAPLSALKLMDAKVMKDVRNTVNRKVNCETANLSRVVSAAVSQREAIHKLQHSPRWPMLPEPLRETAEIRLAYPEDSLSALCMRFDPPLGRSGLNHRLRKLVELAQEENRHE